MPDYEASMRSRRRKRARVRRIAVSVLLIVLFCVAGVMIFFRVRSIQAEGNRIYSQEEIARACGVEQGENLLLVKTSRISAAVLDALPNIKSVQIRKQLPGTLLIVVEERSPAACVFSGANWWILDPLCRVLECTDAAGAADCIRLTGIRLTDPVLGEEIHITDGEEGIEEDLRLVLTAIQELGIGIRVSSIDLRNRGDLTLQFDDRFSVSLGSAADAEQKLRLLTEVTQRLEPDARGNIDLTETGTARFLPKSGS